MSKKRLIPKLQLRTSQYNASRLVLVITKQFGNVVEIGDPVSQAKIFQDQGADELIFVNIDKERKDIETLRSIINQVSEEIFMPVTVGGGVTSEEDFRLLLQNGADKISINTKAVESPEFITLTSEKYGAQCVVVSIDYKSDEKGDKWVYIHNGQEKTKLNPIDWAIECERLGAGEILITSIDKDGTATGLDIEVTKAIAETTSIPVITAGGCGLAAHFAEGYIEGHCGAVAAGSFFAHRDQNFMQTRSQIRNAGVNIRVYT